MNHARFHRIILYRPGAMQVHIIDLRSGHTRACQSTLNRQSRPHAGRIGRRHVITVGRLAPTAQRNGRRLSAHQKQRRPLADIDAVTVPTERIALRLADRFKRFKSSDRESAQRIHSAR